MIRGEEDNRHTLDYSDSESQTLSKPAPKRQKLEQIAGNAQNRLCFWML